MEQPYTDRYWSSRDGLRLHFRDYPGRADCPPVICLHGLTRNARDFSALAEHLAGERRVIVPEMRGRGMSNYASDSTTYHPAQYVEDLTELLAQEKVDRFISIGTSMGGIMTMMMARDNPERIVAAVLNDIGPQINMAGVGRIAGYVGRPVSHSSWIEAARALEEVHGDAFPGFGTDEWLEMAKRSMVISPGGRITFDYDMAIADALRTPGVAAPAPDDLWEGFDRLRGKPLLLVRGALSDLLAEETVEEMRRRHGAMRVVTIANAGHAPTLDEPEAREAIDSLLEGAE